jgi:DNA-directed RNA polymerase subunit RPC12/RpoP
MRSAARQLARLVPVPRSVRPRLLDLSECPHCASRYVQPTDGRALPDGRVSLTLRCPDCSSWMSGTFSAERVRELDRELSTGRAALRISYEQAVKRNMAGELRTLAAAFSMDLIGPDDFTLGRCGARTRPSSP